VLERMTSVLEHRGPDGLGTHIEGPLSIGHVRLSVIGRENGQQPLFNEDGSVVLVCNGEIYNYHQLRRELIRSGHRFQTDSDAEVLVHLWEVDGPELVHRLRGMFAFVLYDKRQNVLFGARDPFGQKPLFYHQTAQRFAFASEIKSLLQLPDVERRVDRRALDQFLFYQYVPHPGTLFEEIRQISPGHSFFVRDGELQIARYWFPEFEENEELSDQQHLDRLETGLRDATRAHLVSDVPVGIFLSGGIDSSLVAALASSETHAGLPTYSISFRGTKDDESRYARLASRTLGLDHYEYAFLASHVEECMPQLAATFDQPLADSAALPLLHLSRQAARDVKVVLTGDGGDEVFAGYRKYRRAAARIVQTRLLAVLGPRVFSSQRLAASVPDRLGLRRLQSRLGMMVVPSQRSAYFRNAWEGWDREQLYSENPGSEITREFSAWQDHPRAQIVENPVNRMLQIDQEHYLPDDLMLKSDYTTMACGLEARAPLLDPTLARLAGGLPLRLKVTSRQTKIALRAIGRRWLPDELTERPKKGFSFPLSQWFRESLFSWVRNSLLDSSRTVPQFFRREHVERVLGEHREGRRDHAGRIYGLLTFEMWYRNFID
jgi:asparagine synthase (glutamine-hydrolysing)